MKSKRYSVEQIVAAVRQHELGVSAADIARKLGIAEETFCRCKKQYGGLEPSEVRELKQLREENAKLKRLVVTGTEKSPLNGNLRCPVSKSCDLLVSAGIGVSHAHARGLFDGLSLRARDVSQGHCGSSWDASQDGESRIRATGYAIEATAPTELCQAQASCMFLIVLCRFSRVRGAALLFWIIVCDHRMEVS